ncbi:transmembrane protease serine 9 isoform X2 [Oryzias melastigma]|uniref:Zgc:100868 n=1 Tax=Oryzias melastigma TaxID=30732 RepID=A0A3B3DN37_ORYME|nr:transmembrane protease serine 9 isoform X2 [Oryzias melastigma]
MALKLICVVALQTLFIKESVSQLSVCGQANLNTRIGGRQDAPAGFWPWQVSLQGPSHFCGGSLINNQWVLTAARCFQDGSASGVNVVLGLQSLQGSNPNRVSRTITTVILHPSWNLFSLDNDIALLQLSSPVNFTDYISPVCLASTGSTFYSGINTWVTGWVSLPSTQTLQEIQEQIVGNRQCKCSYGASYGASFITDNILCAELLEGGKDSCQGDPGGPLVIKQNGRWIQAGIRSFGIFIIECYLPGMYSRVSHYQNWINEQITSNQPGFINFTSTGTDSDLIVSCPGVPPLDLVCGRALLNSQVLNESSVVTAGQWPWMASLQKNGQHVCGGTLVSLDSVLSNANCFSSSPVASEWTVVLGRLKQNGSNPFEVSLKVTNITLSNQTGSNVAVLKLSTASPLNKYIQPICLDNGRTFPVGTTCWAAGWSSGRGGEEEVLQEFQTSVLECTRPSNDRICTGRFTLEQGDSGGPLMCEQDGSWYQAAVLSSMNIPSRRRRAAAVMEFERLSRFQDFLVKTVGTFLSPAPSTTTTRPTTRPDTGPYTEPVTEPTTRPDTGPYTEPMTGPTTRPDTGPYTEPMTGPTTRPDTGPHTKPMTEPTTRPHTSTTTRPTARPHTKPMTRPMTTTDHMTGWKIPHKVFFYLRLIFRTLCHVFSSHET